MNSKSINECSEEPLNLKFKYIIYTLKDINFKTIRIPPF